MNCQDRDVVYGSLAEALLSGIQENRTELLKELRQIESRTPQSLESDFREMGLPRYVSVADFVATLRTLAALEGSSA